MTPLLEIDALRSAAGSDSPAGPLFQSEYAESDLTSFDPMIGCSMATGSVGPNGTHILCCI